MKGICVILRRGRHFSTTEALRKQSSQRRNEDWWLENFDQGSPWIISSFVISVFSVFLCVSVVQEKRTGPVKVALSYAPALSVKVGRQIAACGGKDRC
jgi:hypothetical protein